MGMRRMRCDPGALVIKEEQMKDTNLAARAGAWSAAHWKTATFGWLAFVAAAFALGGFVGTKNLSDAESGDGEAGRAQKILAHAGFKQPAGESVLAAVGSVQKANPSFRVEEFGDASAQRALSKTLDKDFKRAEQLALPATL